MFQFCDSRHGRHSFLRWPWYEFFSFHILCMRRLLLIGLVVFISVGRTLPSSGFGWHEGRPRQMRQADSGEKSGCRLRILQICCSICPVSVHCSVVHIAHSTERIVFELAVELPVVCYIMAIGFPAAGPAALVLQLHSLLLYLHRAQPTVVTPMSLWRYRAREQGLS